MRGALAKDERRLALKWHPAVWHPAISIGNRKASCEVYCRCSKMKSSVLSGSCSDVFPDAQLFKHPGADRATRRMVTVLGVDRVKDEYLGMMMSERTSNSPLL
jgi:hypothetical protein